VCVRVRVYLGGFIERKVEVNLSAKREQLTCIKVINVINIKVINIKVINIKVININLSAEHE
jgi:hypothetical protein